MTRDVQKAIRGVGNCLTMLAPDGTTYYTYNSRNLMTSVKFRTGAINYTEFQVRHTRLLSTASVQIQGPHRYGSIPQPLPL